MKKSRHPKGLLGTVAGIVGQKRQAALLTVLTGKRLRSHLLQFPGDLKRIGKALYIFPESPLDALYQVENVVSLIAHFNGADTIFFCEQEVGAYFKKMHGVTSVFTYDRSNRYLFSREFAAMGNMMAREGFDIVLLLERNPDPALLDLVVRSGAGIRAGYGGAADYPILNVRIGSPGDSDHLANRNAQMAVVLGAKRAGRVRWSVSRTTLDETEIMLNEAGLLKQPLKGGVDIGVLGRMYGREWTRALIEGLHRTTIRWYLYAEHADDALWSQEIESLKMPVFAGLNPSKLAALVRMSSVIISGKSVVYELADLLQTPAVGIFEENVLSAHCRRDTRCAGIAYAGAPDVRTIEQAVAAVEEMVHEGIVSPTA